jgi:hypothetical protein
MLPVSLVFVVFFFVLCTVDKTKKNNKNNLEKLATKGTQDEEKHNKNKLEKLAT